MGLEKFQILFDNPYGVFYAGQNISGKVFVVVNSAKKIRGVTMQLRGRASVCWQEQRHHVGREDDPSNVEFFSSEETYFDSKVLVSGGGNDQTLTPGEHQFPFNYVLPATCPSSFEGQCGHVRYTVKAVLDRPWKFDHEAKATFSVVCPLDLNADPRLLDAVQVALEKTFCCLCCASPPLTVVLALQAGGFVPGETVLPTLEVDNASNVYLPQVKLSFVKAVSYHARGATKLEEAAISERMLGYVDPRGSRSWPREALPIPALPPSNLSNCRLIDLNYCVRAEVIPAGAHQRVVVSAPVVLGTIPFHSHFAAFAPAAQPPPLGWNLTPLSRDGSPNYPHLPPPSFSESAGAWSVREKGEGEHVFGKQTYCPRYPVYQPAAP